MNAGDPDDDAGVAYFLPNGIADDSPPKPTRFSASTASGFGSIGTPASASSSSFFGSGRTSGSSSPAVQEFGAPSLLRPSVLDHSPFQSSRASSSPEAAHRANYLLSDLGGEIHEPERDHSVLEFPERGGSGVGDAASARSGFGYPGSLRSPSSRTFDRGEDAPLGLPFPRARNYSGTTQSIGGLFHDQDADAGGEPAPPVRTSSSSFDMGTVMTTTGLLYTGEGSSASSGASATPSFLDRASEEPLFGGAPMRNWPPSAAGTSQSRKKVLSTPPGLSPPGRGRTDSPLSRLAAGSSAVGGSPGARGTQLDAAMDASSAFDPFKSSGIGGAIGSFGASEPRPLGGNSGRIGSRVPHLSASRDPFGATSPPPRQKDSLVQGGTPNRGLTELNAQSVKMDDAVAAGDVPSDSSPSRLPWQDISSARRIEVQARPKTSRGVQQPVRERRRVEASLEIREGSSLALGLSGAGSPLRAQKTGDQQQSAASPSPSQGSSSSDIIAPSGDPQWTDRSTGSRGRRRHQAGGTTPKASSYAVAVGGATAVSIPESRQKQSPDGRSESALRSAAADPSDVQSSKAATARDGGKTKRKEPVSEGKGGGKAQPPKKSSGRGAADKNTSASSTSTASTSGTASGAVSRRQVYREKHKVATKDNEKAVVEVSGLGDMNAGSPGTKLYPDKEAAKPPATDPKPEAKPRRRRQRDAKELKQSDSMSPSKAGREAGKESSAKAAELGGGLEPMPATFASVVASNKKQLKPFKKERVTEILPETSTVAVAWTSTAKASDVESKAGESRPMTESQDQRAPQDAPTGSSSLEPTESKGVTLAPNSRQQSTENVTSADVAEESGMVGSNDGSSSDADKAQLSTDDEFEMVHHHQGDDATSADESAAPAPAAHASGFRATKQTDQASKKSTVKGKERQRKDKTERKKSSKHKKDKRSPPASGNTHSADATQPDDLLAALPNELVAESLTSRAFTAVKTSAAWTAAAAMNAAVALLALWRQGMERANLKGGVATAVSYVESVLAVVFSVVLLLALHGASWFIRVHRIAFRALLSHRHIGFCFAFLYGFPALVHHIFPWAPPWAPVCLWYAFLVQLFCTNGPTAMMTTFRIILPLVFLVEGISHHSFLLDLNGAELLLTSFILSALKTSNLYSPVFFLSLAAQCLLAVFFGSELIVQWVQLAVALYSLHLMASTEEWAGFGVDDDDLAYQQQQQQQQPGGHSIADYNHHPAPSSAVSIQKTKRLDRRALAYVRGRKMR